MAKNKSKKKKNKSENKTGNKGFFLSMRVVVIAGIGVVLALVLLACFIVLDELPGFLYYVTIPDSGSALIVTLEISNPLFSKTESVSLLLGDKEITIAACNNAAGRPTGDPFLDDGVLYIMTGRGSRTYLTYTAEVATPGKHGNRGDIGRDYAVFDGEQALLLPVDCYSYKPGFDRTALLGKVGFDFYLPDGWEQVIPRDTVEKPLWSDIYAITQDAFVFGKFTKIPETTPGLDAYVLSSADPVSREALDGFNSLYAYYSQLFGSEPKLYSIIALPKPGADTPQVIGGAGRGSVAASFDQDLRRDWQLLSHRMFHAFFDSAAPYATFHMPSNTWFYEGMATYYENMSMNALPASLKTRLDIDVNRQMTLLFNSYLYMRIKDPAAFGYPPMREEDIAADAAIEFLHYTTAPLLVKLLEDTAQKKGHPPDSALRFCVNNGDMFDERFVAFEAAIELLGEDDAQIYCESYLLSLEVPPLWDLKPYQPSDREILDGLNDIEYVIGSWFKNIDEDYPIDTVTYAQLQDAIENLKDNRALFLTVGVSVKLEDYCLPLYALLNDYYYRATQKGISYDDPDIRYKMFAD